MRKFRFHIPYSITSLLLGAVMVFVVVYISLIAVVMGYAASTIGFSESVRDDETVVAELESEYLAVIASISSIDYQAAGYARPIAEIFVPSSGVTALR